MSVHLELQEDGEEPAEEEEERQEGQEIIVMERQRRRNQPLILRQEKSFRWLDVNRLKGDVSLWLWRL